MIKKQLTIINDLGLHARAANKLVRLASGFESNVQICKDDQTVNGKSILGVMMLAAARGTVLTLTVTGKDEDEAAEKLEALVNDRFGEEQ